MRRQLAHRTIITIDTPSSFSREQPEQTDDIAGESFREPTRRFLCFLVSHATCENKTQGNKIRNKRLAVVRIAKEPIRIDYEQVFFQHYNGRFFRNA